MCNNLCLNAIYKGFIYSKCIPFQTVLPAAATDVYYRDEIGNISTSHMRVLSDSVELDLRPRFPLFGGWKTHYVLGYNVPSYEYLFYSGTLKWTSNFHKLFAYAKSILCLYTILNGKATAFLFSGIKNTTPIPVTVKMSIFIARSSFLMVSTLNFRFTAITWWHNSNTNNEKRKIYTFFPSVGSW